MIKVDPTKRNASNYTLITNSILHARTSWSTKNVALYFCPYLCQLLTIFKILSLAHSVDNLQKCGYFMLYIHISLICHKVV